MGERDEACLSRFLHMNLDRRKKITDCGTLSKLCDWLASYRITFVENTSIDERKKVFFQIRHLRRSQARLS